MLRVATGLGLALALSPLLAPAQTVVHTEVAFSPNARGVTPIADLWLRVIGEAKESIKITFYNLTLTSVRDALKLAKQRAPGLDVRALLDRSQADNCQVYELDAAGIGLKIWVPADERDLMHHKFLLVDGGSTAPLLVTGSSNFTTTGVQFSHENQTLLRYVSGDRSLFDAFELQFERMWAGQLPSLPGGFETWRPEAGRCGR